MKNFHLQHKKNICFNAVGKLFLKLWFKQFFQDFYDFNVFGLWRKHKNIIHTHTHTRMQMKIAQNFLPLHFSQSERERKRKIANKTKHSFPYEL